MSEPDCIKNPLEVPSCKKCKEETYKDWLECNRSINKYLSDDSYYEEEEEDGIED